MIEKDNLILRTVQNDDLKKLYEWNSKQARGHFQEFHFKSFTNIKKEYEETGFNSEKFELLIIEVKEMQQIGLIYINLIRDGLVRIGLVISEDKYRNDGYGTKATRMIVEHLYENYPIVRIEAETDKENVGAQRVLEKVGFKKEGVLRNYRYHHKKWRDFVMYSILRDEISI